MRINNIYLIILLCIGCLMTIYTYATLNITNKVDRIEVYWSSLVNQSYDVLVTTNLTEGVVLTNKVQATPPENDWYIDIEGGSVFYQLTDSSLTNIPGTSPTFSNILTNSSMDSDIAGWNFNANANNAEGSYSWSNGELLVDITDGGSQQQHIFVRQIGLSLENGRTYTLTFDIRSDVSRTFSVFVQNQADFTLKYLDENGISIGTQSSSLSYTFTMDLPSDADARIHFGFGGNNGNIWLDNIDLSLHVDEGTPGDMRVIARERNQRLHRGNNFMAAKALQGHGRLEDYELLNEHHFSHCRIGYKLDERVSISNGYLVPASDMQNLRNMVDWCKQMGLIAVVDPVHNWMADDSGDTFSSSTNSVAWTEDLLKLSNIWVQVAEEFATDSVNQVYFEIVNEPRDNNSHYHNVAELTQTGLSAIRSISGNETRTVIICGDGFSTRQALIDEFNNNRIPLDDPYLIGTFHYYDPFTFTKQGANDPASGKIPGGTWGTTNEFLKVETDFDAVVSANEAWAIRNNTQPLPIYMGEFGVDNEADNHHTDRKKWLSWIRMQAEKRDFSWAHWNMYQNTATAKGMGPWSWQYYTSNANQQLPRYFDADPVEALVGRYEFEDGSRGGNVQNTNQYAGYSGTSYASYPTNLGWGVFAQIDDIFIPKDDTYKIKILYSSEQDRTLRVVSRESNNGNQTGLIAQQVFPSTGGNSSWNFLEIDMPLNAGESNTLRVIAFEEQGVQLDWIHVTQ
ncbi:MAG: cellulase family glycosylhydrolase [Pontiellaceae bacterium]